MSQTAGEPEIGGSIPFAPYRSAPGGSSSVAAPALVAPAVIAAAVTIAAPVPLVAAVARLIPLVAAAMLIPVITAVAMLIPMMPRAEVGSGRRAWLMATAEMMVVMVTEVSSGCRIAHRLRRGLAR
jgi:hypothetical protein